MRLIALFLFVILPAANAADFGRIFFTPEQRREMDYNLARNINSDADSGVLMVNGIVQRRGGKRMVWINGTAQEGGRSDERKPASVPITIPGKNKPIEIKVGQRLLLDAPSLPPQDAAGK